MGREFRRILEYVRIGILQFYRSTTRRLFGEIRFSFVIKNVFI